MLKKIKELFNERNLIISEIQTLIDKFVVENNHNVKYILDSQIDEKEYELHKITRKINDIEQLKYLKMC